MLPVVLYAALMGLILVFWVRGWVDFRLFASPVTQSLDQLLPPRFYLRILLALLLIIVGLLFRPQTVALINRMPLGLRWFLIALPFYLLLSFDWLGSLVLLVVGALAWVFYGALGSLLTAILRPVPDLARVPLVRFWPVILYTALFTRDVAVTVLAALTMGVFQLFDAWMEAYFQPIWTWQKGLPAGMGRAVRVARIVVGVTIPILLPYSMGLISPGVLLNPLLRGLLTPLSAVVIGFVTYFVMRGLAKTPGASQA